MQTDDAMSFFFVNKYIFKSESTLVTPIKKLLDLLFFGSWLKGRCLHSCTYSIAQKPLKALKIKIKIKSVTYSSQGSQTGQLDFLNWLADGSTTG